MKTPPKIVLDYILSSSDPKIVMDKFAELKKMNVIYVEINFCPENFEGLKIADLSKQILELNINCIAARKKHNIDYKILLLLTPTKTAFDILPDYLKFISRHEQTTSILLGVSVLMTKHFMPFYFNDQLVIETRQMGLKISRLYDDEEIQKSMIEETDDRSLLLTNTFKTDKELFNKNMVLIDKAYCSDSMKKSLYRMLENSKIYFKYEV